MTIYSRKNPENENVRSGRTPPLFGRAKEHNSDFAEQNQHERKELIPEDENGCNRPRSPGQRKHKVILPIKPNFSSSSTNKDTSFRYDCLFPEEANFHI